MVTDGLDAIRQFGGPQRPKIPFQVPGRVSLQATRRGESNYCREGSLRIKLGHELIIGEGDSHCIVEVISPRREAPPWDRRVAKS